MDIYLLRKDVDLENVVLQPDEVVDAEYLSDEEIGKMIADNKVVMSVAARYEKDKELI